jgi:hypothetical protein
MARSPSSRHFVARELKGGRARDQLAEGQHATSAVFLKHALNSTDLSDSLSCLDTSLRVIFTLADRADTRKV